MDIQHQELPIPIQHQELIHHLTEPPPMEPLHRTEHQAMAHLQTPMAHLHMEPLHRMEHLSIAHLHRMARLNIVRLHLTEHQNTARLMQHHHLEPQPQEVGGIMS